MPSSAGRAGGERLRIVLALGALYIIWGSTYFAIRFGLEGFPPFFMAGMRYIIAGPILYLMQRRRGAPAPTRAEWVGAGIVGILLIVGGNGGVTFAEQWVPSGLAALGVASIPLWTALFSGFFGRWPRRLEWVGLVLGFGGVGILGMESGISGNAIGALAILVAAIAWAWGTVLSKRVALPHGLMSSAAQMVVGGAALLGLTAVLGQFPTRMPSPAAWVAITYLTMFGSLVAFSAYAYLVAHVRPALATSYAYVTPVVAVALGVGFAGERVGAYGIVAMAVILAGVGLVAFGQKTRAPLPAETEELPEAVA